jgi:hypothetical protein
MLPLRFLAALAAALCCSCDPATVGAVKWNAEQRAALSSLAIPTASVDGSGYFKPIGRSDVRAPIIQTGSGSFGQGAAVNAGAALVFEVASSIEQSHFEKKYGAAIDGVAGGVPGDLDRRITGALADRIGKHPFFRGKVSPASGNRLVVELDHYGFVRVANRGDDILVTPTLSGSWSLTLANGKALARHAFSVASPAYRQTVTEFAKDRALTRRAFDEAAATLANVIVASLNQRLGGATDASGESYAAPVGRTRSPERLPDLYPADLMKSPRYPFSHGFNRFISQPIAPFVIDGHELKIAATPKGGMLYVMEPPSPLTGSRLSVDSAAHRALRDALAARGVGIARHANVVAFGKPIGFVLELDGDGWSALQGYRK